MPTPAVTQAAARLWTALVVQLRHAAPGEYHPTPPSPNSTKCRDNGNCTVCSWLKLTTNDPASCKTRFTRRRVRELKNGHNSVTVQNRTHVYMNFFHHKDLGNHLLHLCPKVVKHSVLNSVGEKGQPWRTPLFISTGFDSLLLNFINILFCV